MKMTISESDLKAEGYPFTKKMQTWWVKKYVFLHWNHTIGVDTTKGKTIVVDEPLGIFSSSSHTFKVSKTIKVPDERFADLHALEVKYRDSKITKKERQEVEQKLYDLFQILMDEKRINGHFEFPPMKEALEIKELVEKADQMEKNLNTVLFDLNILKAEAKRKGWAIS